MLRIFCGMVEIADSAGNCPQCGSAIDPSMARCGTCGAEIAGATGRGAEDAILSVVDPEHRVEIAHFDMVQGAQAGLACGMLRAHGIACELSNPLLPGLPNKRSLWVNAQDAEQARKLLAQAESGSGTRTDDAA